jgi:DNA mismatch endonuclease, patch repair protein
MATDELLRNAGWQVIRVWEHECPEEVAGEVAKTVTRCRASRSSASTHA